MATGPRGLEHTKDSGFSRDTERKKYPAPETERIPDIALDLTSADAAERAGALRRVKDRKDILIELASASIHADVRLASVALLLDPKALCEVARYSHFQDSRGEALKQLSGRKDALVDVACSSLF